MAKLLCLSGSGRTGSMNARLLGVAAARAKEAGFEVETLNLRDLGMPLYDGDLEAADGLPAGAIQLQTRMRESDGFLVASPEYNGSITPLLKNAIDWTSRPHGDVPSLAAYRGKVAGLMAASPGGLGGIRGLAHVRTILAGIGVWVAPTAVSLGRAGQAFQEDGSLSDERVASRLDAMIAEVGRVIGK